MVLKKLMDIHIHGVGQLAQASNSWIAPPVFNAQNMSAANAGFLRQLLSRESSTDANLIQQDFLETTRNSLSRCFQSIRVVCTYVCPF